MDPLSAGILGLVQALTEFLPVSSSGHLVLAQSLMNVDSMGGAAFEVAVHFGTLLSVMALFRREVRDLLAATWRAVRRPSAIATQWAEDADLRMVAAIIVGCIPAGVVGLLFKDELEAAFGDSRMVGYGLIATGVLLLATLWAPKGDKPVTLGRGLMIGLMQAAAILPGVSRSGSTISMAMFMRVEHEAAARYSFLMSLPVIAGASALKAVELTQAPPADDALLGLAVGGVVAFVAGLAALWLLMGVVRRGWFSHFGWYCLAIGIGVTLYV
ncbi:MAG: undecaprenyl-diphosphatase [Bradymonadia bacterium]|jgi:undecaprenyl-diphosphatase